MIYRFLKKEGNCVGIGDINMEGLEAKLTEFLNNGYEHSTLAEYVEQVVKGAASVPAASAESAPVEPQA